MPLASLLRPWTRLRVIFILHRQVGEVTCPGKKSTRHFFLGLVQIEINLLALLSFCTKPRQSSSRQIFSREGGGSKPSGIDNSPRTQKKSYGTSTQVCTQANACTAVVQADLEAVACNHCSTKLNACCRLFTLETGPQSPVYGVHSTASVPQL